MNELSDIEKKDDWQLLFNGKTMDGWHGYNKVIIGRGWQVMDGTLHFNGNAKDESEKMICNDIATDKIFSDFHIKLEWKISDNGNSGIMFHVQEDPKYRTPWLTGPEMQLLDNDGHRDGQFIKHRAGDLYDLIACSKETVRPVGEWNEAAIIVHNSNLRFMQNGEEVVSTTLWDEAWKKLVAGSKFNDMPDFAKSRSGKITLQDHGDPVWFRNIKIKDLYCVQISVKGCPSPRRGQ
ncbi:MAG: DUF1080 domain-containing protein [Ferruginibacter sp.]